ncbi:L-arginine-binding protein-like [Amphiura filiformis]|uniref:L-arginine-binding protein-like n=1 Tax=Amphiura filiformis TaxID=82378 RepID=UPI003B223575
MDRSTDKVGLMLVVIALLVAVVALVIACVGLGQKGGGDTYNYINGGSTDSEGGTTGAQTGSGGAGTGSGDSGSGSTSDTRIWTFAIGDGQYREAYIDEAEGTLKGFLVDLVNAVCKVADKNCRIMGDLWTRCWDNQAGEAARGGDGLMGFWYDGCPGWVGTFDRHRTFQFTDPYGKAELETLFVKKGAGASFNWRDLSGKKVGILDGYSSDEHCLAKQTGITGVPLDESQIFHFQTPSDLVAAVNDDTVDVAFALNNVISTDDLDQTNAEIQCYSSGPGVMIRVDNDLLSWWNPAMARLLTSNKYIEICQDLNEEHGHQPGRKPKDLCFLD